MQHTFQQGDRVIIGDATHGAYDVSRCGESGVLKMVYEFGYEVALDKPELNRSEGIWYVSYGDLRHDTDFRKGDWVRYEATENKQGSSPERNGGIAQIVRVYEDQSGFEVTDGDMPSYVARANAVKIQPPVIFNDCYVHEPQEGAMPPYHIGIEKTEEDAIERGIQEKIRLLERQVEKAKCCLETYRDLKVFINQGESHGTR